MSLGDDYADNYTLGGSTTWNSTANDTTDSLVPEVTAVAGYCGADFKAFGDVYKSIHGYTSLTVCMFGALANILNLIVLTRREMINPTNAILTGLALADLLNMVEYIPFTMYMNFIPDSNGGQRKTYGWAVFVLTHSNFSQVCHTISIWLTVTLAVWRYIMVALPLKSKTLCSMDRAKWAIASAYMISPILCIPIYFTFSISQISAPASPSGGSSTPSLDSSTPFPNASSLNSTSNPVDPKYRVDLSDLAKNHSFLMNANFWLYSVVIKIIPCIMLTVVSFRLINSLMEAKKRKDKLLAKRTGAAGNHAASPSGARGNNNRAEHESGGSDRTTRMLLAVLLLFLITEFPQGLLALLSGLLGKAFFRSCYIPLADLMDFVALLNSAINFILYCSMSKKFRDTFSEVFHINELIKLRRQRSGRRNIRPRSLKNHVTSPNTNRHLLGDPDTEQTAV